MRWERNARLREEDCLLDIVWRSSSILIYMWAYVFSFNLCAYWLLSRHLQHTPLLYVVFTHTTIAEAHWNAFINIVRISSETFLFFLFVLCKPICTSFQDEHVYVYVTSLCFIVAFKNIKFYGEKTIDDTLKHNRRNICKLCGRIVTEWMGGLSCWGAMGWWTTTPWFTIL